LPVVGGRGGGGCASPGIAAGDDGREGEGDGEEEEELLVVRVNGECLLYGRAMLDRLAREAAAHDDDDGGPQAARRGGNGDLRFII